jgi:hypothetical protein
MIIGMWYSNPRTDPGEGIAGAAETRLGQKMGQKGEALMTSLSKYTSLVT